MFMEFHLEWLKTVDNSLRGWGVTLISSWVLNQIIGFETAHEIKKLK